MSRHIFIVGNADVLTDHSANIEAADVVVRFNRCRNLGVHTGHRTTELWLTNTGRSGLEFVDPSKVENLLGRTRPQRVLLPRRPLNPVQHFFARIASRESALEYGALIRPNVERLGVRCEYVGHNLPHAAMRTLLSYGKPAVPPKAPSTGILAVHHFATAHAYSRDRISLVGFRFEGWRWHPWELERAYVDDLEARGRLTLHDRIGRN